MRITVRVVPRAQRTVVGGRYGEREPPTLLVRVQAPAVDGRATAACVKALAAGFEVPRSAIRVVSGARARTKVVELEGADPAKLAALLSA